jgi:hypothetical protein
VTQEFNAWISSVPDSSTLVFRRAGFDFEPPPGAVRHVEVRDSYTNTILIPFSSGGVGDVSNIHIHNNTIDGPAVPWVYVMDALGGRRHDWRVNDNVVLDVLGSPVAMLFFVRVDDVEVRNNVSHAAVEQSRKAVEFQGAGGTLVVEGNDFTGACAPYVADPFTAPVIASQNTFSPPESCLGSNLKSGLGRLTELSAVR